MNEYTENFERKIARKKAYIATLACKLMIDVERLWGGRDNTAIHLANISILDWAEKGADQNEGKSASP